MYDNIQSHSLYYILCIMLIEPDPWEINAFPFCNNGMFPNGETINQWVQQVRTLRER